MEPLGGIIQRACGAGESIKPRVERSGTVGKVIEFAKARAIGAKPNLGEKRKVTVKMD